MITRRTLLATVSAAAVIAALPALPAEPIDWQQCEHCDGEFPIETMSSMEDAWFCEKCMADWRECFAACDHRWRPEPHYNTHGDEGKICERCSGFVTHEDAADLGV